MLEPLYPLCRRTLLFSPLSLTRCIPPRAALSPPSSAASAAQIPSPFFPSLMAGAMWQQQLLFSDRYRKWMTGVEWLRRKSPQHAKYRRKYTAPTFKKK
ncbi:unnamed protein product [Vitrella brassicaformis CCMP3155]|uniref:Uncharacterized protein n=1 Tax=Vitrella brassicaformis (strain CCMP3155) TaxID=1169540 RepID=A0A0G4GVS5_VITBC|nr:unnamed protein product [Vitrella brassicaformis CCMP3155]|eukprot:CEM35064.1 unnamed protein product [Vitrella brassicaformis CCMP3155]